MANLSTKLMTLFKGRAVGTDIFGNRYYEERAEVKGRRRRRWVLFRGRVEPSKVPPEWHGWLHYTHDKPLPEVQLYAWQKPHQPNLTGTEGRYLPKGHLLKGGERPATRADYTAWKPE